MKKRGVSPLIAVVLIVGFVIILAMIIIHFVRDLADEQTKSIDCERKANHKCNSVNDIYVTPQRVGDDIEVTVSNIYDFDLSYTIVLLDLEENIIEGEIQTIDLGPNGYTEDPLTFNTDHDVGKVRYIVKRNEVIDEIECYATCKQGEVTPQ